MSRLDDKVAVITGAAGGMGRTHSRRFIDEGAKVVLADLEGTGGKEFAEELGDNALFVATDVTNEDAWENLVEKTEDTFGPIDILINNAGIVEAQSIQDTSYEDYQKTIKINQDGIFLAMKHIYPSMKKTENGSIVNISSVNGIIGAAGNSAYVASKFSVRGLTKAAAADFADDNIRVNSVHPGTISTPMTEQDDLQDIVDAAVEDTPMNRLAEPEEVTELVLFLASDASTFSTGSEFTIDGGLSEVQ